MLLYKNVAQQKFYAPMRFKLVESPLAPFNTVGISGGPGLTPELLKNVEFLGVHRSSTRSEVQFLLG